MSHIICVFQVRTFEHALRVLADWFGPELLSRVTVSSVDGYQGREADVVLFSAVR
jgi:superfamily I DNA and/or RNA helicase